MYKGYYSPVLSTALYTIKRRRAFHRSLAKNRKHYTEEEYFGVLHTVRDLYKKGGLR